MIIVCLKQTCNYFFVKTKLLCMPVSPTLLPNSRELTTLSFFGHDGYQKSIGCFLAEQLLGPIPLFCFLLCPNSLIPSFIMSSQPAGGLFGFLCWRRRKQISTHLLQILYFFQSRTLLCFFESYSISLSPIFLLYGKASIIFSFDFKYHMWMDILPWNRRILCLIQTDN